MTGPFHTDWCTIHDGDVDNNVPCNCGLADERDESERPADQEGQR